jgi:hypothetical protein
MSIIELPEGVVLDMKVYLIGMIKDDDDEDIESEIVVTLGGLSKFSDDIKAMIDVGRIVQSQCLDKIGHSWRVMTRPEIADFRERERAEEERTAP